MEIHRYRDVHMPQLEVEAVRLTHENVDEVAFWCNGTRVEELDPFDREKKTVGINVPTFHGMKRASEGDYVVKGSWGDCYRAKPGGFERDFRMIDVEPDENTKTDDPFEGIRRV